MLISEKNCVVTLLVNYGSWNFILKPCNLIGRILIEKEKRISAKTSKIYDAELTNDGIDFNIYKKLILMNGSVTL